MVVVVLRTNFQKFEEVTVDLGVATRVELKKSKVQNSKNSRKHLVRTRAAAMSQIVTRVLSLLPENVVPCVIRILDDWTLPELRSRKFESDCRWVRRFNSFGWNRSLIEER